MTIDWWTLGLQTVNVLILVWILARFLFRPVAKIIAERQAAAHAALDDAQAAREEAQAARDTAKAEQAEISRTRAELLAKAQVEAKCEREHLLSAARIDADKARGELRAELERMHTAAKSAITDEAAALAVDIAARLLARLPEKARIDGFIDGLAMAVADLPEETRKGIGVKGPVHLRAARALSEEEQSRLESRLVKILGRDVTLRTEVDPSLIAGLELDALHAIVRNHFRADLDRIIAEIARDD